LYKFGKNYYSNNIIFNFFNLSLDFLAKKNLLIKNKFYFFLKKNKKFNKNFKDKNFFLKKKIEIFNVFFKIMSFVPVFMNISYLVSFLKFSNFNYILNNFLLLNYFSTLTKLLTLLTPKTKYFVNLLSSIFNTCNKFFF
jgi:hypothetical protein